MVKTFFLPFLKQTLDLFQTESLLNHQQDWPFDMSKISKDKKSNLKTDCCYLILLQMDITTLTQNITHE